MFIRELKYNLKSLIVWTSIMAFFLIVVLAVYPTLTANGDMSEMLKMFPEEILAMFNMDIFDLDSALGWIQSEGYIFWLLIGGVYSSILGATILSKEESEKTIEYLYALPLTRTKIVSAKVLSGLLNVILFNVTIYIICIIGLALTGDLDFLMVTLMGLAPILLHAMLFSFSLCLSNFLKKNNKSRNIGLALTFGFYLMQMIGGLSKNIEILKTISPFEFFSIRYLAENRHFNYPYLAVGLILIVASITVPYWYYNKKELN